MAIRSFKTSDTPELIALFKECVHTVCARDYTPEQLNVWAPSDIPPPPWTDRFSKSFTLIAHEADIITGFANLENNGILDMLYVRSDQQGQGVAKELLAALKKYAIEKGINPIHADVSLTAKPFFLKMGFKVDREYTKTHRGLEFKNTVMTLRL